jgi:hypothetical protein
MACPTESTPAISGQLLAFTLIVALIVTLRCERCCAGRSDACWRGCARRTGAHSFWLRYSVPQAHRVRNVGERRAGGRPLAPGRCSSIPSCSDCNRRRSW